MSKQKGNHTAALSKYREYILELIKTHNLHYPYHKINLKDKQLLLKYGISRYQYFIKILLEVNWIIDVGDYFIAGIKAKYYSLSNKFLLENNLVPSFDLDIASYVSYSDNNNNQLNVDKINQEMIFEKKEREIFMSRVQLGKVEKAIFNEYTDDNILLGLYGKYPQIVYYTLLADSMNKISLHEDLVKLKFKPNIDRKAKSIGIRCTSKFMNKRSIKKHPDYIGTDLFREEYLDGWFGHGNWVEYDIKGSVPRISRLINRGVVEDLTIDPYAEMYKHWFIKNDDEGWNDEKRNMMKTIFMHLYFDKSVDEVIHHLNYKYKTDEFSNMKTELYELKELTDQYCGCPNNTEVFLHESCIYMDVYKELLTRGIKCVQVYDAFYMKKEDLPKDMDKIIYRCMREYVNKWC